MPTPEQSWATFVVDINLVNKVNGDAIPLIQCGQLFQGKMNCALGSVEPVDQSPLARMGMCSM